MAQISKNYQKSALPFIIVGSSALLIFSSLHSFLLFHTLIELFTIVVSFSIFAIAWPSRRNIDNAFLLWIGIGYFFIGGLDLIHTISYRGLNILTGYDANLPTQLWIAARYLESMSFVAAFLFLSKDNKRIADFVSGNLNKIFFLYSAVFLGLFLSIFYLNIFPDAYIEGVGLTYFKIYSEYVISLLFLLSLVILFKKRSMFKREMANFLSLSLVMKIVSELLFTEYAGVYDFSNMLGHIFRFISVLLLYKAVFEIGLNAPFEFLFQNLKKSEERHRALVEFSPDPIIVHDFGTIIFANDPARNLFGAEKKEEIMGTRLENFVHPKYREQMHKRITKVQSGEIRQMPMTEIEIMRPDGQIIPVEARAMKVLYEGKEVIEAIMRDVSERKKAEEKIRSLAQFPEENPNPVIRVRANGMVQYANKPAREMLELFGWDKSLPLPQLFFNAIGSVLKKGEHEQIELACPRGRAYSIEFAPSQTDGHVNIYGRDITERKVAEQKLAETQEQLRKNIENRLVESYNYLGVVNRKISLLLELERHSASRKNKQEIVDYILSSATGLSGAKVGMIYIIIGRNHFNLVSSTGLEEEKKSELQVIRKKDFAFIEELMEKKKRVGGPCEAGKSLNFNGNLEADYCVALPLLSENSCRGFLFLGFIEQKNLDVQELEFLDVFGKHVSLALSNSGILN